jgi:hypothetical protein
MAETFDSPMKVLKKQAAVLGMDVDGRWSVDTLAEKVAEAQEAKKEADAQAIRDASDTWVVMIRDGFAVEDERLRAGGTFKVPSATADRWFERGLARPGRPQ